MSRPISPALELQNVASPTAPLWSARTIATIALWFGLTTGMVEGLGLLLFQRINWERWGPTIHVSAEIIWISAVVDFLFFAVVLLALAGISRLIARMPALRIAVLVLTGLAVYDWLVLTDRLSRNSCLLLALGVGFAFSRWFIRRQAAVMKFWNRSLPWVVALSILVLAGIEGGRRLRERNALANLPAAAPDAPNVLVIVVDTLRADHLSSYGYGRQTSPNIDRLAQQGVVFENAVSASSWSFPSHASLVTGLPMFENGLAKVGPMPLIGEKGSDLRQYPTIGEALERRGYRTGAFSANRFYFAGNLGFRRGFLHFEDYFHSPADMFARTVYGREFMRKYGRRMTKRGETAFLPYDKNFGVRKTAGEVNDEVLAWIEHGGQRPFFAFLNYFDVHAPYGGPNAYPKPAWYRGNKIDDYDAAVKYSDDNIGQLLGALEREGLTKNTLVVVTSDHGESLGEHGLDGHGRVLYWGVIHVPLVIWYPGHVPPGVRISRPVTNVAIPATIMDLLGADLLEAKQPLVFSGPALSLLWKKPELAASWPEPVSELAQNKNAVGVDVTIDQRLATAKVGPMKSLVTPQWHLIIHKTLGDQLYDWVRDPDEVTNLIHTRPGQEAARRLSSRLQDVMAGSAGKSGRENSSVALQEGVVFSSRDLHRAANLVSRINDHYRVEAEAGSTFAVEVHAQGAGPDGFDPVVAITDADGEALQSCRNPGDDHIAPPGVRDATPDDFDDICINDDLEPGVDTGARLEFKVPSKNGAPVEWRVRVSDWNGRAGVAMNYQVAVRGTGTPASSVVNARQ